MRSPQSKRFHLKIDMNDLEIAFDSGVGEFSHYLDLQSGEIVMVEDRSGEAEEYDFSERYSLIPGQDSRDGYGDMEQFIEAVRDPHLRDLLGVAINGEGAFRRFRDVIARYPDDEKRWFAWKEKRTRERILKSLDSEDIELIL